MTNDPAGLNDHYGSEDLAGRIRTALGPGSVTRAALENLDEFHTRGIQATREIAELAGLEPGMRLLDLGCGLGGPARTFADEFGCVVDGVEIVDEFCRAANMLSRLVGLESKVSVHRADMRDLPFEEDRFDRACTVHTLLNIADKAAMLAGVGRVLKPEGRFFFYEICTGNGESLAYPVPWASEPEHDHIETPAGLKKALDDAGFRLETWEDATGQAVAWFEALAAKITARKGAARSGPTLGLVMGPEAATKSRNLRRNIESGRVVLVRGVARVPGT